MYVLIAFFFLVTKNSKSSNSIYFSAVSTQPVSSVNIKDADDVRQTMEALQEFQKEMILKAASISEIPHLPLQKSNQPVDIKLVMKLQADNCDPNMPAVVSEGCRKESLMIRDVCVNMADNSLQKNIELVKQRHSKKKRKSKQSGDEQHSTDIKPVPAESHNLGPSRNPPSSNVASLIPAPLIPDLRIPKLVVRKVRHMDGKHEFETLEVITPDKAGLAQLPIMNIKESRSLTRDGVMHDETKPYAAHARTVEHDVVASVDAEVETDILCRDEAPATNKKRRHAVIYNEEDETSEDDEDAVLPATSGMLHVKTVVVNECFPSP